MNTIEQILDDSAAALDALQQGIETVGREDEPRARSAIPAWKAATRLRHRAVLTTDDDEARRLVALAYEQVRQGAELLIKVAT